MMIGSAFALLMPLCAAPALADDTASADIVALGHRADAHGPSGTMEDHVHKSGDLMIGLSWMHEDYSGTNRRGTQIRVTARGQEDRVRDERRESRHEDARADPVCGFGLLV